MYNSKDIVQRENLVALVGTYKQATAEVEEAYKLLQEAQKKLRAAFVSDHFYVMPRSGGYYGVGTSDVKGVLAEIKRKAWGVIVDRLEIRRILSIKRREELDRQLSGDTRGSEKPVELPEISEDSILAMFQDGMSKSVDYAREAVFEVFEWLRPHSGHTSDLKTNEKWRIGKKVIIGYAVESGYGTKYRPNYHREKNLTALDNVFHMLDGRGPVKTYNGPLCDAIMASKDGTGETDFFKFKCCKNHNLHVEFKRFDLVQKINHMAGGNRLGR